MTTPDYADKISKLLRKAERAGSEAEAEAFFDKAQELMVKHAISEADLGIEEQDEVTEETIDVSGTHRAPIYQMITQVARINGLKVLVQKLDRIAKNDYWGREPRPHTIRVYLVGFKSDIHNVKALTQSLELQALREMRRWWNGEGAETYGGAWANNHDKNRAKHTFVGGFGDRIAERLREAKKRAVNEVSEERHAARTVETETLKDASDSVALVLRSRKERVDEWYDKRYGGKTRRTSTGQYRRGGASAGAAGREAGSRADLGQPRVKGTKRLPG